MIKFIRKYQKQFLAVFAVFLMVTFVANFSPVAGRGGHDVVHGRMAGNVDLRASDYEQARKNWSILKRFHSKSLGGLPLAFRLASREELMMSPNRMPYVVSQIDNRPEMFLLLSKEAVLNGSDVSREAVDAFIRTDVIFPSDADDQTIDALPAAIASLLPVENYFDRASNNIKVSQPLSRYTLALQGQAVGLKIVEFPIEEFRKKNPTTAPTTQEVEDQFIRFADTNADQPEPLKNPFGFGYRIPDRAKIQFITVSFDACRKLVEAGKTPYQWNVAAHKYYNAHASEFPTTQTSVSTTQPTTRPFDEVRKEIVDRLIDPDAEVLQAKAIAMIESTLATDWTAYQAYVKALPKTLPTTRSSTTKPSTEAAIEMTSSLGPSYNTFEYFSALASDVQKQLKILPEITEIGDIRPVKELAFLPGIGKAHRGTVDLQQYVGQLGADFIPEAERTKPGVLAKLQQSVPLRGDNGDVYLFRITEMQKAETPEDKKAVLDKVLADLETEHAYRLARDAANSLVSDSRSSTLRYAAAQAKRPTINVGPITQQSVQLIPGYTIKDDNSRATFVREAYKLLVEASRAKTPHPIAIIELPREGKLVVAELDLVTAMWKDDNYYRAQLDQRYRMFMRLDQQLRYEWFNWNDVTARTGYQSTEEKKEAPPAAANSAG